MIIKLIIWYFKKMLLQKTRRIQRNNQQDSILLFLKLLRVWMNNRLILIKTFNQKLKNLRGKNQRKIKRQSKTILGQTKTKMLDTLIKFQSKMLKTRSKKMLAKTFHEDYNTKVLNSQMKTKAYLEILKKHLNKKRLKRKSSMNLCLRTRA